MNSSDYLSKKKSYLSSSNNSLNNNSVSRLSKYLSQDGSNVITINTNISNSNIKYLYSIQPIDNSIYTNANNFPLLIYNSGFSSLNAIANDYSIKQINNFLNFLKDDKYDQVFSELTTDETQKILYGLYNLRTKVGNFFGDLIDLYENMFMSIKYFYFLYGEFKSHEAQFLKYKEDSEILNDINKLKEYIKQQQFTMNFVTSVSIEVAKLDIKPEYIKYIQLYGLPYKMIFDPVLLQEIIDDMKK